MKNLKSILCILLAAMFITLPAMADVVLPVDTTVIEDQAFMNDTSLTGTITIPANVTAIGEQAFYNCTGLTGIVFPDAPISIGSKAFAGCTGLSGQTITLPTGSIVASDAFDSSVKVSAGDYPAVVPEMIQAEHTTITIYDYWSGSSSSDERVSSPNESQQAQYDYRDWIESTYNVKIVQKQGGDWVTCAEEMIDFCSAPDNSLRAYIVEPGKVSSLVAGGYAAPWGSYDLSAPKWNKGTVNLWTMNGQHYGASAGAHEPRELVYFNKRILEEAGIDWNTLYDMQAAGTWTWSAFEDLLKKTTQDTDKDGVIDIWGVNGDDTALYLMAVFTNGGSFFDFDANGKLQPTMDSTASLSALNWARDIKMNYWMPQPEDASWDWYKQAWVNGECAFYIFQAYGGFNTWSEMRDMEDEWGAVAFPLRNGGKNYLTPVSENTTVIPNVYDQKTVETIAFFIDLWTNDAPGVDLSNSWIGNKYSLTDERAVEETYAMLRKGSHGHTDKYVLLGTVNDVLGINMLWYLNDSTPAEMIESAMPTWQEMCDNFNNR